MNYLQASKTLESLSGSFPADQLPRYTHLVNAHQQVYKTNQALFLLSAPGRVELAGNHTDHNHGQVLAAAVSMDTTAAVSPRDDLLVHLHSEGYEPLSLDLAILEPVSTEAGTTAALIRGVAAGLVSRGFHIGGFDAVMNSQVLSGSGLSSSAAFEVLICFIMETLYNSEPLDAITRAQISQYAENAYFMKPSGLMDQMASSCGGMVKIDFGTEQPLVERLSFSFAQHGYAMVVVNTRSSHDDLTPAYAAIPYEMKAAAKAAGGVLLRDVRFQDFLMQLPVVRKEAGDRAVLRSLHFYQENLRVEQAANALRNMDIQGFFDAINASGRSSWTLLQNISVHEQDQPIALALAVAGQILGKRGACRVHGGGFAGTTLNFVPQGQLPEFVQAMEMLFGPDCCHSLDVRQEGPMRLI